MLCPAPTQSTIEIQLMESETSNTSGDTAWLSGGLKLEEDQYVMRIADPLP